MRADRQSMTATPFMKHGLISRAGSLLWGLYLLMLAGASWANPDFRAPYSGKKVTEYQVELPVGEEQKQVFNIPRDCPAAHYAFSHGAQQWGSRVERRVWDKVMQDCYYMAFLQQAAREPVHDYVSSYDFMNADLRDLVADPDCGGAGQAPCEPVPPGVIDLRQILPAAQPGMETPPPTAEDCRVHDGLFRGWVEFSPDGMRCRTDPGAKGFRIVAIDFADVNADGYVDAILRLIPLGPGRRHIPLILPLTRMSADGPFHTPRHLARF